MKEARKVDDKIKKGKDEFYAYDEKERKEILKRLKVNGKEKGRGKGKGKAKEQLDDKDLKGINISRYKGLGEKCRSCR